MCRPAKTGRGEVSGRAGPSDLTHSQRPRTDVSSNFPTHGPALGANQPLTSRPTLHTGRSTPEHSPTNRTKRIIYIVRPRQKKAGTWKRSRRASARQPLAQPRAVCVVCPRQKRPGPKADTPGLQTLRTDQRPRAERAFLIEELAAPPKLPLSCKVKTKAKAAQGCSCVASS